MIKKSLITVLSAAVILLCGCKALTYIGIVPEPEPSSEPTLAPVATLRPLATPAPTTEPTPEPTPETTPEPTPYVAHYYGDQEWDNLFMDQEVLRVVTPARKRVTLYDTPDETQEKEPLGNRTTSSVYDMVLLDTVTGADGQEYYYAQSSFSLDRGYYPASKIVDSEIYDEQLTGAYAIMKRPGCYLFYTINEEDKLVAQEDYHAVRILGTKMRGKNAQFYYVATQDGHFGFMLPEQLEIVSREDMEKYLQYGTVEDCAESFSLESFAESVESQEGMEVDSMTEFIYSELEKSGLFFSPGYYHFLKKPLGNTDLYPGGFYQDEVYNSRLFKLWNTAGRLVSCSNSEEMEWDYLDDYIDVERGDLVFFSEYGSKDTAIDENARVVFRGKYSGYITDCGVALGNDRVMVAQNGVLTVIDSFSSSVAFQSFDSARRIYSEVKDIKNHLWEEVISAMYDRLGTPYNNFDRLGDKSFDCSGIVCWAMRSLGVHRMKATFSYLMPETTASGWATTRLIYLKDRTICRMDYLNPYTGVLEDLDRLERGDLVFLFSSTNHKVGHVMVYLGNNTVIHSTTIDEKYRGTLVSEIRPAIRDLYYGTNRISSVGD